MTRTVRVLNFLSVGMLYDVSRTIPILGDSLLLHPIPPLNAPIVGRGKTCAARNFTVCFKLSRGEQRAGFIGTQILQTAELRRPWLGLKLGNHHVILRFACQSRLKTIERCWPRPAEVAEVIVPYNPINGNTQNIALRRGITPAV